MSVTSIIRMCGVMSGLFVGITSTSRRKS